MDAILESALVAGLLVAALSVLVIAAAVSDQITRRPEPAREHFADPATDRWREVTNDFFHPTGRTAARQALLRAGHVPNKKMAPARVASPGAMTTSKENPHARSDRK